MKNSKLSAKIGAPPGQLIHLGKHATDPAIADLFIYNSEHLQEIANAPISLCAEPHENRMRWIQVVGVHQAEMMQDLGTTMNLHPLVLEDVMTTRQRPKVDNYTDYLFIVLRLLHYEESTAKISDEQISLVVGKDYLISFEERSTTIFNTLKDRIRNGRGAIRKHTPDFLAYALIDTIVDYYFVLLEGIGARIEHLEEMQLSNDVSTKGGLHQVHELRREIIFLRKSLWPLREVISKLQRDDESPLLTTTTKFYLKDVYDHSIQILDTVDTFRDLSRGLLDVNLSSMSYRMNEVIKILTVVSTTFVPLTFIASFYGMNFPGLPLLHTSYGYIVVSAAMLGITLLMLRYFKKKRWF